MPPPPDRGRLGGLLTGPGAPEVVHAASHDGRHLWLAVRGVEALALVGGKDGEPDRDPLRLELPAETQGDLLVCVHPLLDHLGHLEDLDDGPLELMLVGTRRRRGGLGRSTDPLPVVPVPPESPTSSPTLPVPRGGVGRWHIETDERDGALVVRRVPTEAGVPVLGVSAEGPDVVLRLPAGTTGPVEVVGSALAGEPDGLGAVRLRLDPWELDVPAPVVAAGLPLVRSQNLLRRPQAATVLPGSGAAGLRWLADGHLVVEPRSTG